MFWQRELYRQATAMTFNQTFELDLPQHGNLGSIGLVFSSAGVSGAFATAVKWRLIDYISKIELIGDGAQVIKSFDGRQALAANYYDDHVVPWGLWRNYLAAPHRQAVVINLGRQIHDVNHYLDLSKFTQVKLRITNDATATQYTTNIQADVVLHWLRDAKTPSAGYYREEEWKLWAPVAGTVEYTNLPAALKIRRILLRQRPPVNTADAKNLATAADLMSSIDFEKQNGQTRLYVGDLATLGRMSREELGYDPETSGYICRTATYGFEVGLSYVNGFVSAPASMGATPAAYPITLAQGDVNDSTQASIAYQADYPLHWQARGWGYMHNTPIFDSSDPADGDLLDPDADGVVNLDIGCLAATTVAGTDHNAQSAIVLSRLVP
jgi:hypothetical protein